MSPQAVEAGAGGLSVDVAEVLENAGAAIATGRKQQETASGTRMIAQKATKGRERVNFVRRSQPKTMQKRAYTNRLSFRTILFIG